jgi:hypothetical protein
MTCAQHTDQQQSQVMLRPVTDVIEHTHHNFKSQQTYSTKISLHHVVAGGNWGALRSGKRRENA